MCMDLSMCMDLLTTVTLRSLDSRVSTVWRYPFGLIVSFGVSLSNCMILSESKVPYPSKTHVVPSTTLTVTIVDQLVPSTDCPFEAPTFPSLDPKVSFRGDPWLVVDTPEKYPFSDYNPHMTNSVDVTLTSIMIFIH